MKKNYDVLIRIIVIIIMFYIYLGLQSISSSNVANILVKFGFTGTIFVIVVGNVKNILYSIKNIKVIYAFLFFHLLYSYYYLNGKIENLYLIFFISLINSYKNYTYYIWNNIRRNFGDVL